jgi:hypothetical protein
LYLKKNCVELSYHLVSADLKLSKSRAKLGREVALTTDCPQPTGHLVWKTLLPAMILCTDLHISSCKTGRKLVLGILIYFTLFVGFSYASIHIALLYFYKPGQPMVLQIVGVLDVPPSPLYSSLLSNFLAA